MSVHPQVALDDANRRAAAVWARLNETPRWRWWRRRKLNREWTDLAYYRLRVMTYMKDMKEARDG